MFVRYVVYRRFVGVYRVVRELYVVYRYYSYVRILFFYGYVWWYDYVWWVYGYLWWVKWFLRFVIYCAFGVVLRVRREVSFVVVAFYVTYRFVYVDYFFEEWNLVLCFDYFGDCDVGEDDEVVFFVCIGEFVVN